MFRQLTPCGSSFLFVTTFLTSSSVLVRTAIRQMASTPVAHSVFLDSKIQLKTLSDDAGLTVFMTPQTSGALKFHCDFTPLRVSPEIFCSPCPHILLVCGGYPFSFLLSHSLDTNPKNSVTTRSLIYSPSVGASESDRHNWH